MDNGAAGRRDEDDELLYPLLHFLVDSTHQSIDSDINHRGEESDYNGFHCVVIVPDVRKLRKDELS